MTAVASIFLDVDECSPLVLTGEFSELSKLWEVVELFKDLTLSSTGANFIIDEHRDKRDDVDGSNISQQVAITGKLSAGIEGGKGGFGAQLRSLAKQKGAKQTRDFGACRDLSGRRLRTVNHEIILAKWKEAKEKGEAFNVDQETPTGINLWFMAVPTWADITKDNQRKKFLKSRYKNTICSDWLAARKHRSAPAGAPAHWGCPRGYRCEFAHGEAELRGSSKEEAEQAVKNARYNELQQAKDMYFAPLTQTGDAFDGISDAVAVGLRAAKRSKHTEEAAVAVASGSSNNGDNSMDNIVPTRLAAGTVLVNSSPDGFGLIGESKFGTVVVEQYTCASAGEYYYEVDLSTDGLMQIGWCDAQFTPAADDHSGDGVGDDLHSWAFDGLRQIAMHAGAEHSYTFGAAGGDGWEAGDTLGCFLTIIPLANSEDNNSNSNNACSADSNSEGSALMKVSIAFVLQGMVPVRGFAFQFERKLEDCCFYPALSLEQGESVVINVNRKPYLFSQIAHDIVSSAGVLVKEDNANSAAYNGSIPAVSESATAEEEQEIVFGTVKSAEDLLSYSMDTLKKELMRREVKCGGTHLERANRLFAIKDLSADQIDPKLRASHKK